MDVMDIANMSIGLHQAQLQQDVGFAVTEKAMDSAEQTSAELLKMMDDPNLGQNIDVLG